jgi:hypothetical protein
MFGGYLPSSAIPSFSVFVSFITAVLVSWVLVLFAFPSLSYILSLGSAALYTDV